MRIIQLSVDFEECELEYPSWTLDDGTVVEPPPNWDDSYALWAMDGVNGVVVISVDDGSGFG